MNNITILDKKTLSVGQHQVEVQKLDDLSSDKPHQFLISTSINGIDRNERWSYCEASVVNRDCDYDSFDDSKAKKLIDRFLKFFKTKKGQFLLEDAAGPGLTQSPITPTGEGAVDNEAPATELEIRNLINQHTSEARKCEDCGGKGEVVKTSEDYSANEWAGYYSVRCTKCGIDTPGDKFQQLGEVDPVTKEEHRVAMESAVELWNQ